jgi:hypothetical protein
MTIRPRLRPHIKAFDDLVVRTLIGAEQSRLQRFMERLPDRDCDSEEEELLAEQMFVEDIATLRE